MATAQETGSSDRPSGKFDDEWNNFQDRFPRQPVEIFILSSLGCHVTVRGRRKAALSAKSQRYLERVI